MFCQKCGKELNDGALFCTACGAKVENAPEVETPVAETPAAEPVVETPAAEPVVETPAAEPVAETPVAEAPVQETPVQETVQFEQAAPTQQAPQQQGAPVQKPAFKMPFKITPTMIIAAAELVVLIIVAIVVPNLIKKNSSPETMAEHYFVSIVNGDYGAAYNDLDIENETAFVNKEAYIKYCQQKDYSKVVNYIVDEETDLDDLNLNINSAWYKKLKEAAKKAQQAKEDEIGKTVNIRYRNSGDESDQYFSVNLTKAKDKKMLFFDKWNVGYNTEVSRNLYITTLQGAKVTFDDIPLTENFINSEYEYEGRIQYKIPAFFEGDHTIKVTMDGRQPVVRKVYANDEHSESIVDMKYSQDEIKRLEKIAADDIKRLYECAKAGKSFDNVKDMFDIREGSTYIENSYKYLVDWFDGDNAPTKLQFSDIKATGNTNNTTVSLSAAYKVNWKKKDWWTGKTSNATYDGTWNYSIYFKYEDGKWLMTSMPSLRVSYW